VRVQVYGAGGWLGGLYAAHLQAQGHVVSGIGHDFCDAWALRISLDTRPDLVVNCAGKTHSRATPNIDGCVESEAMRQATLQANALGAGFLASACATRGIPLVHLSSGCLWSSDRKAFTEDDVPEPVSWYARTKVLGEQLVLAAHPRTLVLRIRMPLHGVPHPRNLLTKLAAAAHVVDVENSVTVVEDLLAFTDQLLRDGATGIVHAVHPQPVRFRDLLGRYRRAVDAAHVPTFIPMRDYKTVDGRSNCTLSTTRPWAMPATHVALDGVLRRYAAAIRVAA
jgi:dTDP-4-dehydrorhamnose reductase